MMELYACGLNAHGQLTAEEKDLQKFTRIASGKSIKIFHTSWSQTALIIDGKLTILGHSAPPSFTPSGRKSSSPPGSAETGFSSPTDIADLTSPFSTHDGLVGAVSFSTGQLHLLNTTNPSTPSFSPYPAAPPSPAPAPSHSPTNTPLSTTSQTTATATTSSTTSTPTPSQNAKPNHTPAPPHTHPRLSALSTSTTFTTAIFLASPAASTIHTLTLPSLSHFLSWYADPSSFFTSSTTASTNLNPTDHHAMLPGRAKALASNAVGTVLLTESGSLYTWGDARYSHTLGRSRQEAWNKPGLVEVLGGLRLVSIAAGEGGWGGGAVTEGGEGFIWGGWGPGASGSDSGGKQGSVGFDGLGERVDEGEEGGGVWKVKLPLLVGLDAVAVDGDSAEEEDDVEVIKLAMGSRHILVLGSDGRVYMAGSHRFGQLGLGGFSDIGAGEEGEFYTEWQVVPEMGAMEDGDEQRVIDISCSDSGSLVLVETRPAR